MTTPVLPFTRFFSEQWRLVRVSNRRGNPTQAAAILVGGVGMGMFIPMRLER